jgi:hypothetical protein
MRDYRAYRVASLQSLGSSSQAPRKASQVARNSGAQTRAISRPTCAIMRSCRAGPRAGTGRDLAMVAIGILLTDAVRGFTVTRRGPRVAGSGPVGVP